MGKWFRVSIYSQNIPGLAKPTLPVSFVFRGSPRTNDVGRGGGGGGPVRNIHLVPFMPDEEGMLPTPLSLQIDTPLIIKNIHIHIVTYIPIKVHFSTLG